MTNEHPEEFILTSIEKSILIEVDNDIITNELGSKSSVISKLLL